MIVVECFHWDPPKCGPGQITASRVPSPTRVTQFINDSREGTKMCSQTHTVKVWKNSFYHFMNSHEYRPMSIVVTKENVAEAIYLLEYKFLCSLSRVQRWLLIIYICAGAFRLFGCIRKVFHLEELFFSFLKNENFTSNGKTRKWHLWMKVKVNLLGSSEMTMALSLSFGALVLTRMLSLGVSALSKSVSRNFE